MSTTNTHDDREGLNCCITAFYNSLSIHPKH